MLIEVGYAIILFSITGAFAFGIWKALEWARRKDLDDLLAQEESYDAMLVAQIEQQYEEAYQKILEERSKRFSPKFSDN